MTAKVLSVDLGGTNMRAAVVDPEGRVVRRDVRPTAHGDATPAALEQLMRDVLDGDTVSQAVIGVPGRVDYRRGALEWAPNLPASWTPWLEEQHLARALGVPVSLANDADLAAVGEAYFGAGRDSSDVVYLTMSTGVGGGVLSGKKLLHGHRSMAEVGHHVIDMQAALAGEPATFEQLAAGTAFGRHASKEGLDAVGAALMDLVRSGDARAERAWQRVVVAAQIGVRNIAFMYTPDVIVIGGGLGLVGEVLYQPIRDHLAAAGPQGLPTPIEVVGAALGDDAGLAGAAAWADAFTPALAGRRA